jgi:hypothetical protein
VNVPSAARDSVPCVVPWTSTAVSVEPPVEPVSVLSEAPPELAELADGSVSLASTLAPAYTPGKSGTLA